MVIVVEPPRSSFGTATPDPLVRTALAVQERRLRSRAFPSISPANSEREEGVSEWSGSCIWRCPATLAISPPVAQIYAVRCKQWLANSGWVIPASTYTHRQLLAAAETTATCRAEGRLAASQLASLRRENVGFTRFTALCNVAPGVAPWCVSICAGRNGLQDRVVPGAALIQTSTRVLLERQGELIVASRTSASPIVFIF